VATVPLRADFEVLLPSSGESEVYAAVTEAPRPSFAGTETILLAEDDPMVRATARRFLTSFGYDVLLAENGQDALRISREHPGPVHLVVTDLVMPGMGGRGLAEHLRHVRPSTPVLYVSGYADSSLFHQDPPASTMDLLEKPYTADTLAAKVREILDREPA
jgi:two-component system cell cycle sensor histidine kinase/response regulator CckA